MQIQSTSSYSFYQSNNHCSYRTPLRFKRISNNENQSRSSSSGPLKFKKTINILPPTYSTNPTSLIQFSASYFPKSLQTIRNNKINNLKDIPPEVQREIWNYLNIVDKVSLSNVCKEWYDQHAEELEKEITYAKDVQQYFSKCIDRKINSLAKTRLSFNNYFFRIEGLKTPAFKYSIFPLILDIMLAYATWPMLIAHPLIGGGVLLGLNCFITIDTFRVEEPHKHKEWKNEKTTCYLKIPKEFYNDQILNNYRCQMSNNLIRIPVIDLQGNLFDMLSIFEKYDEFYNTPDLDQGNLFEMQETFKILNRLKTIPNPSTLIIDAKTFFIIQNRLEELYEFSKLSREDFLSLRN